ncbi:MAG TPA: hypothetical protein VNC50_14200, partial [Planctomycetia bacterium]|nr:hypothetical protein [Planctomycetia bacterium]
MIRPARLEKVASWGTVDLVKRRRYFRLFFALAAIFAVFTLYRFSVRVAMVLQFEAANALGFDEETEERRKWLHSQGWIPKGVGDAIIAATGRERVLLVSREHSD